MRLFRRQPKYRKPAPANQDDMRQVFGWLREIDGKLHAMQQDLARLGTIQATTEQTGRYLAEQEWQRNAATAGARWMELDEDTFKKAEPVETEQERVIRLRKKWEQAREKRGHTE